jgi:hypothetical protein
MVQQNEQTYQTILRKRTKIGIREVISSIKWNFKVEEGNIRYKFKVGSKQELAIKIFRTFLTIMIEKMIEEDVVYYYPKIRNRKFYISRVPKKYLRLMLEKSMSDISKIDVFYAVRFTQPKDTKQDYVIILPKRLQYKLEQAIINGQTYRDGVID